MRPVNRLDILDIKYTKANGEKSDRKIISLNSIPKNLKAIDISDISQEDAEHLIEQYKNYNEYLENFDKTKMKFEDWYSMTNPNESLSTVKYRTFTVDNIEFSE